MYPRNNVAEIDLLRRFRYILLQTLLAYFAAATCNPQALAETAPCADSWIHVNSTAGTEFIDVCKAAADAIAFLSESGVSVNQQITINIVEELPAVLPGDPIGCFDYDNEEVYIISKTHCIERIHESRLFNVNSDEEYYRSIIAHEVAHAVVVQNFPVDGLAWVAQEYAAYITQLATLSAASRARVLAQFGGGGFDTPRQINSIVLMMSPDFFAVSAYRHFMKDENGPCFLLKMLAGEVQLGDELLPQEE